MKKLPKEKLKNGCHYRQVKRSENVAHYEQCCSHLGRVIGHEVFIIKKSPVREFKGNTIEAHEVFPCDEAFGLTAWSFGSLKDANKKYDELLNARG
jgi:hypothetical protein